MYKNFSLTDQERKEILEQHQSKGYKQPLKESSLENSVDEIGLTPDEIDENLGMLARIAAPMAASYVGSKMADTNEDFIDSVKSGYNAVKSGVSNVVGGVQKGMNTLASGIANTVTSDADLKKFNDRILAIANVIKYAKKGTDPKTQQPAWMIINPQSKVNGMRLDEYFKTYRVSVGEVEAAKVVNQQGGKPLNASQKMNTSGNQYMRSFAAHPPTFAKLFNEHIGKAPEKIDGPFMKEIDPSVYEDISYLDAMKADILLMRLFHNDIISKDAFLEVRKPVDEIVKILKGGYFEKEKDLPF